MKYGWFSNVYPQDAGGETCQYLDRDRITRAAMLDINSLLASSWSVYPWTGEEKKDGTRGKRWWNKVNQELMFNHKTWSDLRTARTCSMCGEKFATIKNYYGGRPAEHFKGDRCPVCETANVKKCYCCDNKVYASLSYYNDNYGKERVFTSSIDKLSFFSFCKKHDYLNEAYRDMARRKKYDFVFDMEEEEIFQFILSRALELRAGEISRNKKKIAQEYPKKEYNGNPFNPFRCAAKTYNSTQCSGGVGYGQKGLFCKRHGKIIDKKVLEAA